MQNQQTTPEVQQWVGQKMQEAAKYAYTAGLYGLPDKFREILEAAVRNKATEIFPDAAVDPAVLRGRRTEMSQRRDAAFNAIKDNSLGRMAAQIVGSDSPKALFSWRGPAIATVALALWGLLHHERTWDGWCVLLLGAALAALVLPAVPTLLHIAAELVRSATEFARNVARLRSLERSLVQVEAGIAREEDLRHRSQQWATDTTALLWAEYEHNKNIARRARLVA